MGRDCKDCANCDSIRGFMCTCHYTHETEHFIVQVGQDVSRRKAERCEFYSEGERKKSIYIF